MEQFNLTFFICYKCFFNPKVSITKIVEEPKYAQFKSTLNSYIEEHFSATLAYRYVKVIVRWFVHSLVRLLNYLFYFRSLAQSLCHVLEDFKNPKMRSTLTSAVKVCI